MVGGVEKPDLRFVLGVPDDPNAYVTPEDLTFSQCKQILPVVEPIKQRWTCQFGFRKDGALHTCTVILAVQADDHVGIWNAVSG